ncbi:MAG: hypothetical protein COA29_00905 [Porticoccus sp.]|nr:MAG: hypothetical protein COA29_00905 [Porticoccus sp.]
MSTPLAAAQPINDGWRLNRARIQCLVPDAGPEDRCWWRALPQAEWAMTARSGYKLTKIVSLR